MEKTTSCLHQQLPDNTFQSFIKVFSKWPDNKRYRLSSNRPLLCGFGWTYYSIIAIFYNVTGVLSVKPFELVAVLANDFLSSAISRFCLLVVKIKSGVVWLIRFSTNASPDNEDEVPLSLILCLPAGYSCASISGIRYNCMWRVTCKRV